MKAAHLSHLGMKKALTKHLLAVVLSAAIVWYTVVIPTPAPTRSRPSGERPPDTEEREVGTGEGSPIRRVEEGHNPQALKLGGEKAADDSEWPEIIDY